jgi:DNA repair ATPase RecN
MIMTEHIDPIPDDLPTCQERLRAVLERLHHLERLLHDLERQLDETCATTEELRRSYACLKEEYLVLKESIARKPGWIWGSLGRDRENRIGTRSMTPNWLLA